MKCKNGKVSTIRTTGPAQPSQLEVHIAVHHPYLGPCSLYNTHPVIQSKGSRRAVSTVPPQWAAAAHTLDTSTTRIHKVRTNSF
ncbi:unnamed protein product [Haemonchus placei]|uniref:Uncharacterized protein n=1 Tax=Haemonchus placei TaxID=6290 RepID=A0A0N4WVL3_HAEPC|nr:unnamed protein product [Haemonchus placei]